MTPTGHIVLGGLGHLGLRIAQLLRERGLVVTAIEQNVSDSLRATLDGLGCRLLVGDIRDNALLEAADVAGAHAVLCVTGDDQANLEAAIAARRRNPDARVIVRLYDQSLARLVEHTFGVQALSASFLAAPAFLAAASGDTLLATFDVNGCPLHFYRAAVPHALPLARGEAGWHYAPEAPTLFVATEGMLMRERKRRQPRRPHERLNLRTLLNGLHCGWRFTSPITRLLLAVLLGVIVISVIIFTAFRHMPLLDAFYFVIVTLSTVGYGDINLSQDPPLIKLYGVFLMIFGATMLATLYAILADIVLAARMEALLGRRPVTLENHTVVVGLGKVGYRVATALAEMGVAVAGVEADGESETAAAARQRFPVVIGDAARASVREKAGLHRARVLLALTENPMLNLSLALHAREVNPEIVTIVRTYGRAFAEKLAACALDAVISTSAIAAPVFVDAALYPGVEGSFTVDGHDALLVTVTIPVEFPCRDQRADAVAAAHGLTTVLIADGGRYRLARAEDRWTAGTRLVVLCDRDALPRLVGMTAETSPTMKCEKAG